MRVFFASLFVPRDFLSSNAFECVAKSWPFFALFRSPFYSFFFHLGWLEILEFSSPLLPAANAAQAHVSEPNRAKSTRATRAGEGRSRPSPAPSPSVNVYLAEPARPEASARRPLVGPNHLATPGRRSERPLCGPSVAGGRKASRPCAALPDRVRTTMGMVGDIDFHMLGATITAGCSAGMGVE